VDCPFQGDPKSGKKTVTIRCGTLFWSWFIKYFIGIHRNPHVILTKKCVSHWRFEW
jgi:hypothetical protein